MGLQPKYKTSEELEERCNEYFIKCDEMDEPYTIVDLALNLGFMDRHAILNYKGRSKAFNATVKRVTARIEGQRVRKMLKGSHNVAGCIFDLKNNFGYKDKQETEISGPGGGPIAITAYPPEPEALAQWEVMMIAARKAKQLPEKT